MGWVEGAFAEAADLYGFSEVLLAPYDRPEWLSDLLEFCTEMEIAFARAQVAAGADIIGLGDAIASQVSPAMYEQYALPYEQRIFAAVHEMGALARLHICGNTTGILGLMPQSGADIIDLDWMADIGRAAELFGTAAVCGNQDPVRVMLNGTPEEVREKVLDCLNRGGPRVISNAGCEIPDGTPVANLHAQTAAIAEFGAGG
jgi:MtaA/CmuA family methyltransferase